MKKTPAEQLADLKREAGKPLRPGKVLGTHDCLCRKIRHQLGLTIRDVAIATELSVACVCDIERGAETTLTTARTLAGFYGLTIDDLWPTTVDQPPAQQGKR